ncbi:MAG: large conductance mechanosensitive channel protein MscL [Chitinophagaceae bacterium]|nr:large conductance mechanosensitive channel protein MscL [Chitinophagaceae bacterium]MBP6589321.1 large conductance mechanosensitive channel protein MscL [Chitinophagaceae bacterium]MBP8245087.1 large conductance mechanosensitive channel protein MscL [Chitinophagaceae bacterium]
MGMLKEFKEFAMKGNIVDLAVAVVIGGAFGNIVTKFNESIISPLIAMIMGKGGLSELTVTAGSAVFPVGLFIQAVIDFILIAFVLFLVIKAMNSMKKKEEAAPAAPAPTPEDIQLLREIRDALKK